LIFVGMMFRMSRFGGGGFSRRFAFADYIRGMSDEEYERFKSHFHSHGCHGGHRWKEGRGWPWKDREKEDSES
jgi:hypothetical protein